MEEPLVEVVPKTEDVVPVIEKNSPVVEAPAAKSKGGRPAGAQDKAPRKKKLVIVEEPIAKAPVEIEKAKPRRRPSKNQSDARCSFRSLLVRMRSHRALERS